MEPSTIQAIVAESEPGGLVYLMSAPMTGGELFGADALQRCIESAAKRRDDLSYAAGFGIRTGADVRKLCEVGGLDAVIVGTAYLEAAGKSQAAVEDLVEELAAALA
jgi:tryptophan synthase alpha subunit